MRKILLAGLIVALLAAGWCPTAQACPLGHGKVIGKAKGVACHVLGHGRRAARRG